MFNLTRSAAYWTSSYSLCVFLQAKLNYGVLLDHTGRSTAKSNYLPTVGGWGQLGEKCKQWKDKCNCKWSRDYERRALVTEGLLLIWANFMLWILKLLNWSVTFVCLQWAGVPCEGTTEFWVSHDGSYMEVGQKNVKGNIWKKVIHV